LESKLTRLSLKESARIVDSVARESVVVTEIALIAEAKIAVFCESAILKSVDDLKSQS
jgi:hypothetical protein